MRNKRGATIISAGLALVLALSGAVPGNALDSPSTVTPPWRDLAEPTHLYPADGAIYYSFITKNGSRIHLVVADMKSGKWRLVPALNAQTMPVALAAERAGASAAINGGYFNLTDGESTSYVVLDGQVVADPRTNKALVGNLKLTPHLESIYSRCEIRILTDRGGKQSIQIAPHDAPVPEGKKILHSLQAGPQLLPESTEKQEAFVRTDADGQYADSIGCGKQAARTAFGITNDGYAIMLCASGPTQQEGGKGLTLSELQTMMKDLGCTQAINMDGGSSTSMFVRLVPRRTARKKAGTATPASPARPEPQAKAVCAKDPATKVKSALLLLPAAR